MMFIKRNIIKSYFVIPKLKLYEILGKFFRSKGKYWFFVVFCVCIVFEVVYSMDNVRSRMGIEKQLDFGLIYLNN